MNPLEEAKAFSVKAKDMTSEALREALKQLPEEVQDAYWDYKKASYFAPENAGKVWPERFSPSGKYKLVVTSFSTGPGSWNYTQGQVFRQGSDTPIATVQRNYSAFPALFVEDHPKGAFLVCGEDYQGQTVIELDTGRRRDFIPEEAKKGHGFCWAEYRFDVASQMLLVCGCYWACPYEFRFYDFSNPIEGWPEIEADVCLDEDAKWPVIGPDGTIQCFQTTPPEEDADDENPEDKDRPLAASLTFKREGLKLIQVNEWVSEAEKKRRAANEEARRKYEQEIADFKASDPLYLAYIELVKDPVLSPESYESMGITHDTWCPDFKGNERRYCRRIITSKTPKITVDLEWAVKTGPIKIVVYKDGKHVEDKFFGHSIDGMKEAFAYAKAVLS